MAKTLTKKLEEAGLFDTTPKTETGLIIKDASQLVVPNTAPQSYIPGYVGLQQQVNKMVNYQTQISHVMRQQNSKPKKAWYSIKAFWNEKILGKKCYTLEELFEMQTGNVHALNANLIGIIGKSRQELKALENYQKTIYGEFCSSLSTVDDNKLCVKEKMKLYHQTKKALEGMKKKEANYFKHELAMKNLKREIMEDLHRYSLINERIMDLSKEKDFLNAAEDLSRISVQTCEKIASKTLRIERHVSHTMRCYEALRRQQTTVASLESAVSALTDFTMQVHNILNEGLSLMVGVATNSENFYEKAGENLTGFLKEVSEATYAKDCEVEEAVKKYMEGRENEFNGIIETGQPEL